MSKPAATPPLPGTRRPAPIREWALKRLVATELRLGVDAQLAKRPALCSRFAHDGTTPDGTERHQTAQDDT
jgi:hypothetical protein